MVRGGIGARTLHGFAPENSYYSKHFITWTKKLAKNISSPHPCPIPRKLNATGPLSILWVPLEEFTTRYRLEMAVIHIRLILHMLGKVLFA